MKPETRNAALNLNLVTVQITALIASQNRRETREQHSVEKHVYTHHAHVIKERFRYRAPGKGSIGKEAF